MGLDMRYLVVTLVAVFLALGLGILVGGIVMGEEGLAARQDALVAYLEAEFERLRTENRRQEVELEALRDELADAEAVLEDMVPVAVEGRLEGQRVAVIATAGELPGELLGKVLRWAGAEIVSVTAVATDLDPADFAQRVTAVLAAADRPPVALAGAIAGALLEPLRAEVLGQLAAAGLVTVSGDYRLRPTGALLLGGAQSASQARPEDIDLVLAAALRRGGVRVVGAERSHASVSYLEHYLRAGIPCLDHLETPAGLVSLVYLLAGEPGPLGRRLDPPVLLPRRDNR